jgi:hypothetical protein
VVAVPELQRPVVGAIGVVLPLATPHSAGVLVVVPPEDEPLPVAEPLLEPPLEALPELDPPDEPPDEPLTVPEEPLTVPEELPVVEPVLEPAAVVPLLLVPPHGTEPELEPVTVPLLELEAVAPLELEVEEPLELVLDPPLDEAPDELLDDELDELPAVHCELPSSGIIGLPPPLMLFGP